MAAITKTCSNCQKQFLITDQEQAFYAEKKLPEPLQCPTCRQMRRLQLRGERTLYKTKCQKCGKEIVVSFEPSETTQAIFCREDYEKYFAENDAIINEPLPQV